MPPSVGVPTGDWVSTRPGRLDLAVQFGPMDHAGKIALAELILDAGDEVQILASDLALVTAAQVQPRCAELALARLYAAE